MSAPQELEKTAMTFVANAVEFEKQGETAKAISLYKKAIDRLNKLVERYPNHGFSKIYRDRADLYQERITALQAESAKAEAEPKATPAPQEPDPPAVAAPKPEPSVDFMPILLEINRKLDELKASVAQLQDDVVNLKVNVNDASAKTELTQKEVTEIRNILYSIKYDR